MQVLDKNILIKRFVQIYSILRVHRAHTGTTIYIYPNKWEAKSTNKTNTNR